MAKGCRVWDLDGNEYLDFTMCGIGACMLGYADPEVEDAVVGAVKAGNMATLNCPEEVELAELLCSIHPWASMVRYARSGGEIMAMAVRIARAATGRDKVAFCGYHGWHDWYLSVNLTEGDQLRGHLLPGLDPLGVPRGLRGTMLPFKYNQLEELKTIVAEHGSDLAAIVLEVVRNDGPEAGFLEGVRDLATRCGAVLLFDEITSAWRTGTSGMHMQYGVAPDLATFAKTMSNGYPMAAVIGRGAVMDYAQRTFISSAYWTEKIGPAAALATLKKHSRIDAGARVTKLGQAVREGWQQAANAAGLNIKITGLPAISTFAFNHEDPLALHTLFIQEMLRRGFLASDRCYPTCAHGEAEIAAYVGAVHEVFEIVAGAVECRDARRRLHGPVKASAFGRLN
jgi:glutamate-1-semialdehyde aminotransferase